MAMFVLNWSKGTFGLQCIGVSFVFKIEECILVMEEFCLYWKIGEEYG